MVTTELGFIALIVWFLPRLHLAIMVPFAAVFYFAVLILLRTFDAADSKMLASPVRNKPLPSMDSSGKGAEDFNDR